METATKESQITQLLKDKLNIDFNEAKKIFNSIEEKISDKVEFDEVLKVVRTLVTANPIKSILIALAIGLIISKLASK